MFPKSAIRLQRNQPQVTTTFGAFLQADGYALTLRYQTERGDTALRPPGAELAVWCR